ncbi:aspartate aminotransferase [candidate division KSB1 bacterium 4572_119]|nr:MAG: aspartate aminotransferase [candidate division KSB1 bacterium 4572_119]
MISKYISHAIEKSSWIRKMFEAGNELKKIHGAENVFDLSLGNPILEPPDQFFDLLKKLSAEKESGKHRYMSNAGFIDVREKIVSYLSKNRILETTSDNVVMSCGAGGGLNVILRTILDQGDEVIVLTPFFSEYQFYVRNHHGKVVFAETDENFDINIENIEKKINKKTKAIMLNSPNNPTGKVYDEKKLKELIDFLNQKQKKFNNDIYLISDEPYREIVYDNINVPPVVSMYNNSFFVYSWSKSLAIPGNRIGYIAVNPNMNQVQEVVNGLIFCTRILGFVNAPALMQQIVGELLETTIDVGYYEKKKNYIYNKLTKAGYEMIKPEGTFYLFPKAPGNDDIKFVDRAKEEKVLIVPGEGFARKGHFRISYCTDDRTIENACERLARLV